MHYPTSDAELGEEEGQEGKEVENNFSAKEDERMLCILILGKSKSGKSVLVRSLIDQFAHPKRPVYIVNDKTNDCPYEKLKWTQLEDLKNAALIFEDLIACSKIQFKTIQEMLNYYAHHNLVSPIICVSHSLHNNNIFGLLPYFNIIFISAVQSSLGSLKSLLQYYQYEPEEKILYLNQLKNCDEKDFNHFMINVEKRQIKLTCAQDPEKLETFDPENKLSATPGLSAQKFLGHLKNSIDMLRLFDIIYQVIPTHRFNEKDLTVKLPKKCKGRKKQNVKISLIDYLSVLTSPNEPVDETLYKFHKYLRKKKNIILPKTYVKNKKMHW
jgi:GTPase SAR1 family protein